MPPAYVAGKAAEIMGGRVVWGDPEASFAGAAFDSRMAGPGELFIAIKGERTDGHVYLADAAAAGATCFLVGRWDDKVAGPLLQMPDAARRRAAILAPDPVLAAGKLASHHRRRYDLPVIAISGSVGKTTAKDMAAHILESRFDLLASEGNLNSDVSLPVVLLRMDEAHECAVLEMATRGHGQLAYLADLALPAVGVVTIVAPVHVETLGSVAGVAQAKAELLRALPADGIGVYNADSTALVADLARGGVDAQLVSFGFGNGADVRAGDATTVFSRAGDRVTAGLSFSVTSRPGRAAERLGLKPGHSLRVTVPYPGRHNVTNVLASAMCAAAVGMPLEEGLEALAGFEPKSAMRLAISVVGGRVLIDDAYNANLLSMTGALEVLGGVAGSGRKAAVLADMLELGPLEAETHRELGRIAARSGLELLACVGPASRVTADSAVAEGMAPEGVLWTMNSNEAAEWIAERALSGDAVLVKGSRGMAMEEVVAELRRRWGG